jgi:hypothetical protein
MLRLSVLLTVALVAAAVGDTLVEWLADAGVFGRGFFDGDQRSVVPTLACAGVLGLELVLARALAMLRGRTPASARDVLLATAELISRRSLRRDLAAIFALQLAGVCAMESAEAALRGGALAGGLGWLGAPVVAALAVHALVCVLCVAAVGAALRALVALFGALVLRAFAAPLDIGPAAAPFVRRVRGACAARAAGPHVHQRGERAPPFLPVHS